MATKRVIAPWWKYIFYILSALGIMVTLAFLIGAEGVRSGGASIKIDRSRDYQLYKVNDEAAFYGKYKENDISLCYYEKAFPLFRIFGEFEYDGEIMTEPSQQGDWFYVDDFRYMQPGRIVGYNGKTKEKILKKQEYSETPQVPTELLEKGISPNKNDRITYKTITKLPQLSVPKESAITTSGGFIAALLLWLLVLPFAIRKIEI